MSDYKSNRNMWKQRFQEVTPPPIPSQPLPSPSMETREVSNDDPNIANKVKMLEELLADVKRGDVDHLVVAYVGADSEGKRHRSACWNFRTNSSESGVWELIGWLQGVGSIIIDDLASNTDRNEETSDE